MVGKGLTRVSGLILPDEVALRSRPYTAEGFRVEFPGVEVRFQGSGCKISEGQVQRGQGHGRCAKGSHLSRIPEILRT